MRLPAAIKLIVILHLTGLGAVCLLNGIGADIPLIKYKGLEAHNIPVGIALCLIGLAVAIFWKIEIGTKVVEKHQTKQSNGALTTTTRTSETKVRFMPSTDRKEM